MVILQKGSEFVTTAVSKEQRLIIEIRAIKVTEMYQCVCLFINCVGVKCGR